MSRNGTRGTVDKTTSPFSPISSTVKEEENRLPESYQEALEIAVKRMEIDVKKRNILVAHQFVTGAGRCDSEEVSVGGLDNVDASVFDDFFPASVLRRRQSAPGNRGSR